MIATVAALTVLLQPARSEYLSGETGRSVAETIAGLEWDEVSSDYLPNGVEMRIRLESQSDNQGQYPEASFVFDFPGEIYIVGSFDNETAGFSGCRTYDEASYVRPEASFCRFTPEFRLAVLSLIALGYQEIDFAGEFDVWPVDMEELNITRDDVAAFVQQAAELNQQSEAN